MVVLKFSTIPPERESVEKSAKVALFCEKEGVAILMPTTLLIRGATALLLISAAAPSWSQGNETPILTRAFSNAPGAITIDWDHSGEDVAWFRLQLKGSANGRDLEASNRSFTVLGLQASTLYEFRVCAVYLTNQVCSEYVAVETMPPERQPPDPPPPSPPPYVDIPPPEPPPYQALHSPVLKALALRTGPNMPIYVELRWVNPLTEAQKFETSVNFLRNGKLLNSGDSQVWGDSFPLQQAEYYLCLENPAHSICGEPVKAGLYGVEARFKTVDGRYMMHSNWNGYVDNANNDEAAVHASFILRPGLDGGERTVSFESTATPGHFFVNEDGRIVVQPFLDVPAFWHTASFVVRPPLGARPLSAFLSFESVSEPGEFLRYIGNELRVTGDDGTAEFEPSASFIQEDPFVPADPSRLAEPTHRLGKPPVTGPPAPERTICESALAAPGVVPHETTVILLQKCIESKADPVACEQARDAYNLGLPQPIFARLMEQCLAAPDR